MASKKSKFHLYWYSVKSAATGTFLDQRGHMWTSAFTEKQARGQVMARLRAIYKQNVFVNWDSRSSNTISASS